MRRVTVIDRRRPLGVALVLGVIALVLLAAERPNPFAGDRTVRALFADSQGIAPVGAEVRMAGTRVGEIVSREQAGDLALVTMKVQDGAGEIHRDATAALRPRLMFEGTAYVELTAGSPGAPGLGDDPLPLSQTTTPVSLADTLDLLGPEPAASLRTDAHELRRTLSPAARRSLQSVFGDSPALVRDAGAAADAVRAQDALRRSVRGAARVASAVASRRSDLAPLVADSATTSSSLRGLGPALDSLPATLRNLDAGGRSLAGTVDRLTTLAVAARPGAERLAPTLRTLRPLLREARPVVAAAAPFVDDLDRTLRAARSGAAPVRTAIDAVEPTVGYFRDGLLDALEKPTSLGTPSYLSFLGLFAGGGGASRPFSDDGRYSGHFMRFGFRFLTGFGSPAPPCTLIDAVSQEIANSLNAIGGCQR